MALMRRDHNTYFLKIAQNFKINKDNHSKFAENLHDKENQFSIFEFLENFHA